MNRPIMKDLYDAMIDDAYDLILKEGGDLFTKFLELNPNLSKIENIIYLISTTVTDVNLIFYQKSLIEYLGDINILIKNGIVNIDIEEDDCLRSYGLLCGIFCWFKKTDESIFKSFDISKFVKFSEIFKKYDDVDKLKEYYLIKFNDCNVEMSMKKKRNIFQRWFTLLCQKKLDSIPKINIKEKEEAKKKKHKKKKKKTKEAITESTNEVDNEENEDEKLPSVNLKGNQPEIEIESNKNLNQDNQQDIIQNNNLLNEESKSVIEAKDENQSNDNNDVSISSEKNEKLEKSKILTEDLLSQLEAKKTTFSENENLMYSVLQRYITETEKNSKQIEMLKKHQYYI